MVAVNDAACGSWAPMMSITTDRHGSTERTFDNADEGRGKRSVRPLVISATIYLLLALFMWWNVWTSHPTATTTCGCGDSAKFTWFFGWTAHAIAHGLNPFYTTYLYHPHGINLLADTSSTAVGILLAPITWAFGPIATLNVALTLAPALTAISMFVLLRRWCAWSPAVFIGGLVYGFSPFVIVSLASGWVDFALLAIPPLCVLCLDDLLVRHLWHPIATGLMLGLLLVVQFFIGTEVLLMTVGFITFGIVLHVAFAALHRPGEIQLTGRPIAIGLGTALATSFFLLAYPAWFALRGPASFSGRVWGGYFEGKSTLLRDFFLPAAAHLSATDSIGYQGPYISPQYIGIPCLVVIISGIALWRRDLRLWFFATIAGTSALLSYLHPLGGLPLVQNIIPDRYVLVTYFAVAALLCLTIQHVHDAIEIRAELPEGGPLEALRWPAPRSGWVSALGAGAVTVVALLPIVLQVGQTVPFTTQSVVLPDWFQTVAPRLEPDQVLLVLPVQYITGESPLTWQSVGGFKYKMAEEGGPAGVYIATGRLRRGAAAVGLASSSIPFFTQFTSNQVVATRAMLKAWGITMVVIPDQPGLPVYEKVASVPLAAALMTAAIGRMPVHQENAWVWNGVDQPPEAGVPTSVSMKACVAGSGHVVAGTVERVIQCVFRASS